MKTAVKHCVSSAYQIGTGGGVEGRRGLAPPPIRLTNRVIASEFPCEVKLFEVVAAGNGSSVSSM